MTEQLQRILLLAAELQLHWILCAASAILILVDYFFPTDVPARLAYLCFALGISLMLPLGAWLCVGTAVAIWLLLEVLHRVWFRHILTNAPGVSRTSVPPVSPDSPT